MDRSVTESWFAMIGYVYLTTNIVNNKKYIGQHRASNFDPNYVGSGKLILRAIQKYTKSAFKCEILCTCDTKDELDYMERYYISKYNAVRSSDFYNISEGGYTGSKESYSISTKNAWKDPEYRKKHVDAVKAKWADPDHYISHSAANRNADHKSMWTDTAKEIHRKKQKIAWSNPALKENHSYKMLKLWSDPKRVQMQRERNIGKNNPSYGKRYCTDGYDHWIFCTEDNVPDGWYFAQFSWINNGVENRRIERSHEIPNGWIKGKLSNKTLLDN